MPNFKNLERLLEEFSNSTVPGCACSVMKDGELIFEGYTGYADLEENTKVTSNSMFRQASTTKLFTYAIIAMLYEEGRFLLSDPISEYLPEYKSMMKYQKNDLGKVEIVPLENPITIKDAVTMSCGLPYCMVPDIKSKEPIIAAMSKELMAISKDRVPTLREEVRAIANVPVLFEPGTHWLYGFGSEITGAIVEEITGKPLRKVFHERLIDPLGLKNTGTYISDDNKSRVVSNYTKYSEGKFSKLAKDSDFAFYKEVSPERARVNLLSSATDFAIFMQMLAQGGTYKKERYLGRKTVDLLRTNYLNDTQLKDFTCTYLAGYGYGLGFRTLMNKAAGNHNGSLGAFGWTGGSGIWVEADPLERVSISYMHNMRPNEELYHHLRVRTVAYGCLD